MKSHGISRRRFLAALAAAASPALGAAPAADAEADVIIVGSGFGGLAAAIEARRAGAEVLLVEKMAALGGNSSLSAGDMAVPDSPVQRSLGIAGDSPELMASDLIHNAGADPARARTVAGHALETWRWTAEQLGVDWNMSRIQGDWGQSVPRGITLTSRSGFSIVQACTQALERLKAGVRTECRLVAPVFEGGRAAGIEAEGAAGERLFLRARRGIVMAYGGFSADAAFRSSLNPLLTAGIPTSNQPGATSEAWRAMIDAGAGMLDLDRIQVMCWNSPDERGLGQAWTFIEYVTVPLGQWFDTSDGTPLLGADRSPRARTETLLPRCAAGHAVLAAVSQKAVEESGFSREQAAALTAQGILRTYGSPEALAAELGCSPAAMLAAMPSRDAGEQRFCALSVTPKVHHCQGGLRIDAQARVYSREGRVMPGLYAAGECTGGLFRRERLPSHSVADALVTGRIAGVSAAGRV